MLRIHHRPDRTIGLDWVSELTMMDIESICLRWHRDVWSATAVTTPPRGRSRTLPLHTPLLRASWACAQPAASNRMHPLANEHTDTLQLKTGTPYGMQGKEPTNNRCVRPIRGKPRGGPISGARSALPSARGWFVVGWSAQPKTTSQNRTPRHSRPEGETREAFHQPCLRVSQPAPDVGCQRNDMSARLS